MLGVLKNVRYPRVVGPVRAEANCILCFVGTFYFFFKCVALKMSCGRIRLDFKGKMVWFEAKEVTPIEFIIAKG